MNTIYQVLSNLKHNDELHTTGSFLEAAAGTFDHLVEAGVLRVIDGAKSIEHAAKLVATQAERAAANAAQTAVAPQNTWGAQSNGQNTWGPQAAPETPVAPPASETTAEPNNVSPAPQTAPETPVASQSALDEADKL